ncbi:hypothetical protein EDD85DRAFT_951146 [Armillaria nabsnona]|nr:hypothetical protein EDD85DRAFT_951146 [Armillaria nabsnona]
MAPAGAHLTLQQLIDALTYKVLAAQKKAKETVHGLIEQIDELEKQLQIAAARLRGFRNSLQPIHRLPPELLATIFYGTQQHLPSFFPMLNDGTVSKYDEHHRDWLSLLHVCRRWRGVIASSPFLWASVDTSLMLEKFLKRSASAPLTLYLGIRKPGVSEKVLDATLRYSRRFREFHIAVDGWEGGTSIYPRLCAADAAPRLASLTIMTEGRDVVGGVLPPLFSGQIPSIRQLCLAHFTSWPAGLFANLTHLCLHDQSDVGRMTTSEFLDFIEQSPRLEELNLIRAGPIRPDASDAPAPPRDRFIPLPHLRELDLGDWPSVTIISRLLSHLVLPKHTNMYFWGVPFRDTDEDFGKLLPIDNSRLANLHNIKKWYLARQPLVILDTPCISVAGSVQTLYMYGTFTASQIESVLPTYPLRDVTDVGVRDSCARSNRLTSSNWKHIFQRLPHLASLRILAFGSPSTTRSVLQALRPKSDDDHVSSVKSKKSGSDVSSKSSESDADDDEILCPSLITLGIEHDATLPAYFVSTIAEARAKRSCPIKTLKVLVYHGNPFGIVRPPSPVTAVSDSDTDQEYQMHTEDDMRLFKRHFEEVAFEKDQPLSMDVVPRTWPTRAYEWTRRIDW